MAILCVLAAILSKKASPLVALIAVPVTASLAAGFGLKTSAFVLRGIASVAPVAGMFIFAILYFGVVTDAGMLAARVITEEEFRLRRPRLFWPNVLLTLIAMAIMNSGRVEPVVVFMTALVIALTMNYPSVADQRKRIEAHARAALLMASILFAAGAFTGIMRESGMLAAMAHVAVQNLPSAVAHRIPVILGVLGMPLSLVFDPDSFYLGVLPVIAEVGKQSGHSAFANRPGSPARFALDRFPCQPVDSSALSACRTL